MGNRADDLTLSKRAPIRAAATATSWAAGTGFCRNASA